MAKSRTVSVGIAATRLDSTSEPGQAATSLQIYNPSAVIVYYGGSDVTSSNGFPLAATTYSPGSDLGWGEALYAVVASTTSDVKVFEVGV